MYTYEDMSVQGLTSCQDCTQLEMHRIRRAVARTGIHHEMEDKIPEAEVR